MVQAHGKNRTAFWLGIIVGLVGLFGVGHLYLSRRKKGDVFLAWSALLYVDALAGFLMPQLWQTPISPAIVFGLGWIVQTYDLYTLTEPHWGRQRLIFKSASSWAITRTALRP